MQAVLPVLPLVLLRVVVADGRDDLFTLSELWRYPHTLRAVLSASKVVGFLTVGEAVDERDRRRLH